MIGKKAHLLAKDLWPLNRSITGEGVKHLKNSKKIIPDLKIREVKKLELKHSIGLYHKSGE